MKKVTVKKLVKQLPVKQMKLVKGGHGQSTTGTFVEIDNVSMG